MNSHLDHLERFDFRKESRALPGSVLAQHPAGVDRFPKVICSVCQFRCLIEYDSSAMVGGYRFGAVE